LEKVKNQVVKASKKNIENSAKFFYWPSRFRSLWQNS